MTDEFPTVALLSRHVIEELGGIEPEANPQRYWRVLVSPETFGDYARELRACQDKIMSGPIRIHGFPVEIDPEMRPGDVRSALQ